jgi:hypothetical protein
VSKLYDKTIANAASSSYGEMLCSYCKERITTGQFLAAKKTIDRWGDWEYVTMHRKCSETDHAKTWGAFDLKKASDTYQQQQLLAACKEFRGKWNVSELDDLIQDLEGNDNAG